MNFCDSVFDSVFLFVCSSWCICVAFSPQYEDRAKPLLNLFVLSDYLSVCMCYTAVRLSSVEKNLFDFVYICTMHALFLNVWVVLMRRENEEQQRHIWLVVYV